MIKCTWLAIPSIKYSKETNKINHKTNKTSNQLEEPCIQNYSKMPK